MIYIITDTNYLHCSFKSGVDFLSFHFNKNFNELLDLKNNENCVEECTVCLSEMVYQELLQQKNEAYKIQLEEIEEISRQMGKLISCKINTTWREYAALNQTTADKYVEEHQILKIPFCKEHFEDIIWDAIHKFPPFEGINGKSDKGFKDVVIWYSMIEYAKEHPGNYLFISADNIFVNNRKVLSDKFMEETGCKVNFCKNVLEVRRRILKPQDKKIESAEITSARKEWEFWINQELDIKVSWDYPWIADKEMDSIKYINNDIRDFYETILKDWKNWHSENVKDFEYVRLEEGYSDELRYEILLNENGILCMCFSQYVYLGGPHGTPIWHIKTYDLNTGRQLQLRDVVSGTDAEIYRLITERFQEEKEAHCDFQNRPFYFPEFTLKDYRDIDDFKFFITPEGVHIYFDVYEAGPYSEGFISFLITKDVCHNKKV